MLVTEVAVRDVRAQLLLHQRLDGGSVDLLRRIERPMWADRAIAPGIEEIELGMRGELALRPPLEYRETNPDQQLLEDRHVALDDLGLNVAVARDGR
jgi:hypothetical protein